MKNRILQLQRGLMTEASKDLTKVFNFGPVTSKYDNIYGSTKPGPGEGDETVDQPDNIGNDKVKVWAEFMKSNDVDRVICLLNEKELGFYKKPGYKEMLVENGFDPEKITMVNMFAKGEFLNGIQALQDAVDAEEKVVVHCNGGSGRTGTLAGYFLLKDKTDEESLKRAVDEIGEVAKQTDRKRKTNEKKLTKLIETKSL